VNYQQLNKEILNIVSNRFSQSDSTAFLSQLDNYEIICVKKNTAYKEQLPDNLFVNKLPHAEEAVNYIILSKEHNPFLKKTVIEFHGSNNIFFAANKSKIGVGDIRFYDSKGMVILNENSRHKNWFTVWMHSPNSCVYWGKDSTSSGVTCVTNDSKGIFVDDDCMIAANTWIRCSDMHDIFDLDSREVINNAADVLIESHVWIAQESLILKGANIKSGSIIGARSLVTGEIPRFSLATGSPAKVIKQNVSWHRTKEEGERKNELERLNKLLPSKYF
jgi:acetyltransferase-like isoleucine patch superfamily enzyme